MKLEVQGQESSVWIMIIHDILYETDNKVLKEKAPAKWFDNDSPQS